MTWTLFCPSTLFILLNNKEEHQEVKKHSLGWAAVVVGMVVVVVVVVELVELVESGTRLGTSDVKLGGGGISVVVEP